ncbi:hypothetical protein HYV98_00930 [Candidatus Azambacteria bacterium]|nr:hypothetical protein [Candidatus Azambacteria bacterium]
MPTVQLAISKCISELLKGLASRTREVIEKRFGLKDGRRWTLESIGQQFGITRERVRQIEADGLRTLRRAEALAKAAPLFAFTEDILKRSGGLREEGKLYEELSGALGEKKPLKQELAFLLTLSEKFSRLPEEDDVKSLWCLEKQAVGKARDALKNVEKELNRVGAPVAASGLEEILSAQAKVFFGSPNVGRGLLEVSTRIAANPFGEYGLKQWSVITPRGVRDKAYLVLKKEGKPLHFRMVSERINAAGFSNRKAHPQTVHNELIKDQRFVLVGRGMYGLKEWGYEPGTVREVMLTLFKKAQKPLTREEVLSRVLEKRFVKENTILLNLQNRKYFLRTADGRYTLKVGVREEA